jgi:hypothetical protein
MDAFEMGLNEARAEIQFFRVALQIFYLNMASRSSRPSSILHEMKHDVIQALERLPVRPQKAQGDQ